MKRNFKFVVLTLVVLFSLSCGALAPSATPTPAPTATPAPTDTPTPLPTDTPLPTATTEPTPAPVGSSVKFGNLEVKVLDVVNRESVHFGDVSSGWETFYKPNPGFFLIDVGVLVRNLDSGNAVSLKWKDIYVVEENGDASYPLWGNTKMVSKDGKMDPFSISLSSTDIDGDADVQVDNDTYFRLIFGVKDDPKQTILFGIQDSPKISFNVN